MDHRTFSKISVAGWAAATFAALLASYSAFRPVRGLSPITVGRAFYVWLAVFNLFVISVFWSLLADLFGAETARQLYGPIAAGGTIGGIIGPRLTSQLVDTLAAIWLALATTLGGGFRRRVTDRASRANPQEPS